MLSRWKPVRLTTIICSVCICSTFNGFEAAATPAEAASGVAAKVVQLTNAERRSLGRGQLRTNARLMRAAQLHAEQIAHAGQPAHVLPNAAYPRAEDRLAA